MTRAEVLVVGGGLAGSECAWQLAKRGISVELVEAKPLSYSPAHQTPLLCELVCSNSLRSNLLHAPAGLLKDEMRQLDSLVIACADAHAVPAGSALAVERFGFGREVTVRLARHPKVTLSRRKLDSLPDDRPVVIATGPLTSGPIAQWLKDKLAGDKLYFYDAIAPIVAAESIDPESSFRASRWGEPEDVGDYINCPMDQETYEVFVREVLQARKIVPREFEEPKFFEGCLPIEVMAERGMDVLRHGPMRPVGLTDPKTGRWPYAVVQLRPENKYFTAYNLVGFQTRMAYPEQARIFSMIPALKNAEFLRFGSIHRNSFLNSPALLNNDFSAKEHPNLYIGGLLTGVEGYIESCAMGLLVGRFIAERMQGSELGIPPAETALGGLYRHVTEEPLKDYSPTNVNFGLLPGLKVRAKKRERKELKSQRAQKAMRAWLAEIRRCP